MNAQVKIKMPITVVEEKPEEVLIHVRYLPNADIFSIDARPEQLSASEWFKRLSAAAPQHYQALAGGRGFFRIPRQTFDAIPTQG